MIGLAVVRWRLVAAVALALLGQVILAGCGEDVEVHRESRPVPSGPEAMLPGFPLPCAPSGPETRGNFVRWSRDGASIAFYRVEERYEVAEGIYQAAANGSAVQRIETLPDSTARRHEINRRFKWPGATAGWHSFDLSPGGTEVVYSTCATKQLWGESDDTRSVRVRDLLDYHYHRIPDTEFFYTLVRARTDGTASQRLGRVVLGKANYPSWSPDGTRIALRSDGLVTMAADGSSYQRIAIGRDGPDGKPLWLLERAAPQWSPDSQRLAVTAVWQRRPPSWRAVYTVGANGADLRRLVNGAVSEPTWSPDGQRLAYARLSGKQDDIVLATIAADGTDERYVTTIESRGSRKAWIRTVAWSPNGAYLVYSCGLHLCVVRPDGTPVGRTPAGFSGGSMGAWSPDGTRLAVSGIGHALDGSRELLYTMAPDGGQRCPVVIDTGVVEIQRHPFEEIRRMLAGAERDHPMVAGGGCEAAA